MLLLLNYRTHQVPPSSVFRLPRLFNCRLKTRAVDKLMLYSEDRDWLDVVFFL